MDEILSRLPPTPCSNPSGPEGCYCARGTTKPIAELAGPGAAGEWCLVRTFCSPANAKLALVR